MKNDGLIKGIQYLRGIAALLVVFFHFRYYLNNIGPVDNIGDLLFGNGAFGVDLFFIISGFIICYSTRRDESRPLVAYFLKRFFRIYPLMLASLLVFYLLIGNNGFSVLRSMIPLHADYGDKGPFFGYNMLSPVWTLTYEIFFYVLFLVGLSVSKKHRAVMTGGLILTLFLALQWMLNHRIELSAYSDYDYPRNAVIRPVVAILSSPMILEFVCGMALYKVLMALPDIPERGRPWMTAATVCAAVMALAALFSKSFFGHGLTHWGVPALVLVTSLLLFERLHGLPYWRPLIFLGNISYSLYLTHIIVIKVIRKYHVSLGLDGLAAFAFAVAVSIGVAAIVYYAVEVRSIAGCRRLLAYVSPRAGRRSTSRLSFG